ncbi:hypothetical protein N7U66_13040 [Lacinutrix neustonica]|uniref:Polysaccharide biosynthesis protein n=1 Tax=Lacinutrix neustonica TaxID=2980107 RepID=A0A9E8MVL9_9FLAO|nr:hypothetical protein [Lacinutrix neustonica]WAC01094.1 hypothetical protein N7U66_13040 [Lacinutrix neustonica]
MLRKLKQAVFQVLESSRKKIDFKTINYLPRWAILCFDTVILIIALMTTKLIVSSLKNISYFSFFPTKRELIVVLVNVLFFILFRTYAGLIRHSTFIDAVKFFLASVSTLITILGIYFIYYLFTSTPLFVLSEILLYAIISFCGLFLFRILVKQIFETYLNYQYKEDQLNILVYGTDENAIAIASALKSEKPSRYKVLGFVDKDGKNKSKEILGLPIIYLHRKMATILRAYKAQALIIADNNLTKDESIVIIDNCIDYNFKVFRAPLISNIETNKSLSNQIEKIQIEDILERDPIKLDNKLVAKEIYNKCILVTGGAGSIGSEIAETSFKLQSRKTNYFRSSRISAVSYSVRNKK